MGDAASWDDMTADSRVSRAYNGTVGRGATWLPGALKEVKDGCLVSLDVYVPLIDDVMMPFVGAVY